MILPHTTTVLQVQVILNYRVMGIRDQNDVKIS